MCEQVYEEEGGQQGCSVGQDLQGGGRVQGKGLGRRGRSRKGAHVTHAAGCEYSGGTHIHQQLHGNHLQQHAVTQGVGVTGGGRKQRPALVAQSCRRTLSCLTVCMCASMHACMQVCLHVRVRVVCVVEDTAVRVEGGCVSDNASEGRGLRMGDEGWWTRHPLARQSLGRGRAAGTGTPGIW